MKIALMFLAVANILYFMWGQFVSKPVEPGVVVVNGKELGPALSVSRTSDVEAATSVGTVLGSGRSAEFAAVVGSSCVSIGPFKSSPEADAAMTEYRTEGMRASVRTTEGQLFVGHWVQIRNIPDREAGNAILEQLRSLVCPFASQCVNLQNWVHQFISRTNRLFSFFFFLVQLHVHTGTSVSF